MSKANPMTTDTDTTDVHVPLTARELDAVSSGGSPQLYQYCDTGAHLSGRLQHLSDISEMQQMDINK